MELRHDFFKDQVSIEMGELSSQHDVEAKPGKAKAATHFENCRADGLRCI